MDYQSGKIYKICSHQTKSVYVGSTKRELHQRLRGHLVKYKNKGDCSSKEILKYPDYYIELIENYPCNNRKELTKREGYYIREYGDKCVNIQIAGRQRKEYYQDNKLEKLEYAKNYRIQNIEKKKADDKKYREQHKEKMKEYLKQYNKDNNVILLQKKKEYREANKDKRKENSKKTYTCECGSTISLGEKSRHNRSKKHLHHTTNIVSDLT